MVNTFINGIFKLILMLTSAILSPIVDFITYMIPNLGNAITNVISFLSQILINIPMILDLLFIPNSLIVFFMDYIVIKYSIYLGIRGFKACVVLYNKFKP